MSAALLPLTRASALQRLAEFAPFTGKAYASRRNFVAASGDHPSVSRLSAALRRRLISEREVVEAVLGVHPFEACETFIAEVFWRTYWKGWLEHHPAVWTDFQQATDAARSALDRQENQKGAYAAASAGRTGIQAFDHWARELAETGYLHNWARMQVASIWVFTLRLPWQLGAEWMFRQLADADPASNTLSWRWVCGLHTAGKTYLADPDRIARMTGGVLHAEGLATTASLPEQMAQAGSTLVESHGDRTKAVTPSLIKSAEHDSRFWRSRENRSSSGPARMPLRPVDPPDTGRPSVVLLTPEDLSLETELGLTDVRAVILPRMLAANAADRIAMADALRRAASCWGCQAAEIDHWDELTAVSAKTGGSQIVTGYLPVGPSATALASLRAGRGDDRTAIAEHQRRWDRLAWESCTKGFFALRARIPFLLGEQGLLREGSGTAIETDARGRHAGS